MGSRTGRGAGYCSGSNQPGFASTPGAGGGRGLGRGPGCGPGRGLGRGAGRGMGGISVLGSSGEPSTGENNADLAREVRELKEQLKNLSQKLDNSKV
ncbi:MAG: DUF5320 domain-containing protein [Desulfuromonadaceae bacterium]|nr:DUF5320 domain-containing protein [Desulfuromonadaceae bacterium]